MSLYEQVREAARTAAGNCDWVDEDPDGMGWAFDSADAASDVWEAVVQDILDSLDHHLDVQRDPCDDRGVLWPCDVAEALYKAKRALGANR